jgi:uncharacterized membrane protein
MQRAGWYMGGSMYVHVVVIFVYATSLWPMEWRDANIVYA